VSVCKDPVRCVKGTTPTMGLRLLAGLTYSSPGPPTLPPGRGYLTLKEVFADRDSDERRQHNEHWQFLDWVGS
jgi:hypothetical protein